MTFAFKPDLYSIKMDQHAKYLGQILFSLEVIVTFTHTPPTDCCTWTTQVVSNNAISCMYLRHLKMGEIHLCSI